MMRPGGQAIPNTASKITNAAYAPMNAAPFPAMNSSAAPGDNVLSTSMATAEPTMQTAKYCGLRSQGPLKTRTIRKLVKSALRMMSGIVASLAILSCTGLAKIPLSGIAKLKAFPS